MSARNIVRYTSFWLTPPWVAVLVCLLWNLPYLPAQASPDTPTLAAARRAINATNWPGAEAALRQGLRDDAQNADAAYLLGFVLFHEQRATDSLAAYTAAAHLRAPTADELMVVASDYILLKAYADAERWLRYATQHFPQHAAAWYLLGRTQYQLDHAADAAASFSRCLQLLPHDVRAEYNLGLAYEKLDRAAEAEQAYRQAITWNTAAAVPDPQPYLDLGMLLLAAHRAAEALPVLRQAVAFGAGNALAHQELALTLETLGRDREAVPPLERAIALAPTAEQPHFFLGRIYRRLGDEAGATREFAEAKRLAGTRSGTETPNPPATLLANPR